jgi:hypothetical protein
MEHIADDKHQRMWISDLRSDSGIRLSPEDINAELHRRRLYMTEQPPPKKLYRVEDPDLQIIYVVKEIAGYHYCVTDRGCAEALLQCDGDGNTGSGAASGRSGARWRDGP